MGEKANTPLANGFRGTFMAALRLRIPMDLDRLQRLTAVGALIGLGMVVLGLVGEVLGWWNDVGEILISLGGFISVLLGLVTFLLGATKGQVRTIANGIVTSNATLDVLVLRNDAANTKLDLLVERSGEANGKLNLLVERSGEANGKLDLLVERSGEANGKLDLLVERSGEANAKLDAIHEVLRDIRDRL
jgi:hypothetical protein